MNDYTKLPIEELYSCIGEVYSMSEELIKRAGYWKYYKALGYDYETATVAFEIAEAIYCNRTEDHPCEVVLNCLKNLWDQGGMSLTGMSEDEWAEEGDDPMWERDDWKWNEETEEWELVEDE